MNKDGSLRGIKPDVYLEAECDGYQNIIGKNNNEDMDSCVAVDIYQYGSNDPWIEFCTEDIAIRIALTDLTEIARKADEYLKNNY